MFGVGLRPLHARPQRPAKVRRRLRRRTIGWKRFL